MFLVAMVVWRVFSLLCLSALFQAAWHLILMKHPIALLIPRNGTKAEAVIYAVNYE